MSRSIIALALAGTASTAAAQGLFTVALTADRTTAAIGETITWTLAVTDGVPVDEQFGTYDLNLLANDDTLATASPFVDALSPIVFPMGGTPSGASLFGVTGGQATIANPLGGIFGSPITIGTFQVVATQEGSLTYALEDGGNLAPDHFRVPCFCFGPHIHDGPPEVFIVDTVTIVPAPASTAALACAALALTRRRR